MRIHPRHVLPLFHFDHSIELVVGAPLGLAGVQVRSTWTPATNIGVGCHAKNHGRPPCRGTDFRTIMVPKGCANAQRRML